MSASSGSPCLKPKLSTAICSRWPSPVWSNARDQLGLQLVDVEVGGVDHEVGRAFDRVEQRALELDRLDEAVGLVVERMLAPRRRRSGAPARRSTRRGTRCARGGRRRAARRPREHVDVLAPGHERQPLDVAARLAGQLDDRVDQRRRQVVDHEPAEVLEHRRGRRAPGAGQPGDHDDVGHWHRSYCLRACAVRRYSSRGIVAASRYSLARARGSRAAAPARPSARSTGRSRRAR